MALSVFAAFVDRYQSLTNVPPLSTFDEPVSIAGAQVYPSYSVLIDEGTTPQYDFELLVIEVTNLLLMVYCETLEQVDAAIEAIKYNGGTLAERQGMDNGQLPTLAVPYRKMAVIRRSEKKFAAKPTGKDAQRIHGCEMQYEITVHRT